MVVHMAVELRCPECRTKLRLKTAPEAGTEVECPKCGSVFSAPEPEPEEGAEPKKPKKAAEKPAKGAEDTAADKDKKTATKTAAKGPDEKSAAPNAPKKRKAKKKETSKTALIGVISAGGVMMLCMIGVLIWFFGRTSKAVEMFYYVPEDANLAIGVNLGHAQKYPAFYKSISGFQNADFKTVGDAIASAAGSKIEDLMDYVVRARSPSGGHSIVYRTKDDFDDAALGKLPGAQKQTLDGKTFYVSAILPSNERARVFAPTKRLIVVCPEGMNDGVFKKILNGHADSKEKTLGVRMGDLGKRLTRGTFWRLIMFEGDLKPSSISEGPNQPTAGVQQGPPPVTPGGAPGGGGAPAGGGSGRDETAAQRAAVFNDALSGSLGCGIKASLGSREVRFEIIVGHKEGEKAVSFTKKMKEGELGKGDEGNTPRWFKEDTQSLGDKKIAAQLLSNIGFGASGTLFYTKSAVDTADLVQSAAGIIGKVLGQSSQLGAPQGANPGGGPPGGGPPGGGPPGGFRPPGGGPPGGGPPGGFPPGGGPPGGGPPGGRFLGPKMRRRTAVRVAR
jgi:predicted Zn finger-like uncharacterized protein